MNDRERDKWLDALLDNTLTQEQAEQLLELLKQDKEAMARFREDWEFCNLLGHVSDDIDSEEGFSRAFWERVYAEQTATEFSDCFGIRRDCAEQAGLPARPKLEDSCSQHEYTIAERDQFDAQEVTIERTAKQLFDRFIAEEQRKLEELAYRQYRARRRRLIAGCTVVVAAAIIAILELVVFPLTESPMVAPRGGPAVAPIVATITDAQNALWSRSDLSTAVGTRLTASDMTLKQGLLQATFDGGAVAILQAPCQLRLTDAESMFLEQGIVSVNIRGRGSGFGIKTPTGTVTDYGTEFAVVVGSEGQTEAQVFQGRVVLQSDTGQSLSLTRASAAAIDVSGMISRRAFRSRQIIRKMPRGTGLGVYGQRLNLADVVSGGNGFETGTVDQGIDLSTGVPKDVPKQYFPSRTGPGRYMPVPALAFVDGVFVPDSEGGPVQISSTGLIFEDSPNTNNTYCGDVFGGGWTFNSSGLQRLVLDGKDYRAGTRAIYAHANMGITFDLQAIRQALPGIIIARFTARCGISETAVDNQSGVDFWVLVDGRKRFHRPGMLSTSGGASIDLKLNEDDRFLTLIATDADQRTLNDWGLFAEPVLELDTVLDVSTETGVIPMK